MDSLRCMDQSILRMELNQFLGEHDKVLKLRAQVRFALACFQIDALNLASNFLIF